MTSGQYSYLILQKLRRLTSCENSGTRAYLYNICGKILKDPGLQINGEIYQEFSDLLDEIWYDLGNNYIFNYNEVFSHEIFDTVYQKGQLMFQLLGIKFYFSEPISYSSSLTFELPSGNIITITTNPAVTFNIYMNVTSEYFEQIYPYYFFTPKENDKNLLNVQTNVAGYNTHWSYDEEKQFIYINGEGTWADYSLWNLLDISSIKAFIIGPNVSRFLTGCMNTTSMTLVDYHDADAEIIFDPNWTYNNSDGKSTVTYTIYTDNEMLKNYQFVSTTVTFHSLSEWKGE